MNLKCLDTRDYPNVQLTRGRYKGDTHNVIIYAHYVRFYQKASHLLKWEAFYSVIDNYLRFFLLAFDILPNKNAPAATPMMVFVFLLKTCLATRFKFCGLSARRRMK